MDDFGAERIRQIERVAKAVRTAVIAGANAYANGVGAEKPIVDQHFTAGNQMRYGWAPLSREYFLRKQRGLVGKVKGGVFHPGGGKTGSKLDKAAQFQSGTGTLVGIGTGTNAPMLVLTGALRAAVSSKKHAIQAGGNGDTATVTFSGLPEYAIYLQDGAGMPQRSPVDPNAADMAQVEAVIRRHVDAAMGTGGKVAISQGAIPDRSRMA